MVVIDDDHQMWKMVKTLRMLESRGEKLSLNRSSTSILSDLKRAGMGVSNEDLISTADDVKVMVTTMDMIVNVED